MKVIFIGGLHNGKMILDYLFTLSKVQIEGIYVLDEKYNNDIPDFVKFDDIIGGITVSKVKNISQHELEIVNKKADLIIIAGWSQLVSKRIIDSAKVGVIGYHPAVLPKDRGRSVIAWQIVEGYKESGTTMFWIDEGVDSGDIIGQEIYPINYYDSIRDVLDKADNACLKLTMNCLPNILKGDTIRKPQDERMATNRRKREKNDGLINWKNDSFKIYNLIRAISLPYPCAHTYINGKEVKILSAKEDKSVEDLFEKVEPGTIVKAIANRGIVVKAGSGGILIESIIMDGDILYKDDIISRLPINTGLSMEGE